jgi:DNA sulfur modification protein DndD
MAQRLEAQEARREAQSNHREIEAEIALIPDIDISDLHTHRDKLRGDANTFGSRRDALHLKLYQDKQKHDVLETDTNELLSANVKGRQLLCELNVAGDMERLFSESLKEMEEIELQKVSDLMNEIFLRMIGAVSGAENSGIIQRAEINAKYKIIVHGNSDNILNPSQDLNGASRRALTLAFIMALTKVSEVVAPNVIDTPLGMTSGYVKNSILKLACQYSTQLVLLLTHDEIKGCEDLIDEFGGSVTTVTNPAHYPKILINDPEVSDIRVIQCECNHRTSCTICERRESEENKS